MCGAMTWISPRRTGAGDGSADGALERGASDEHFGAERGVARLRLLVGAHSVQELGEGDLPLAVGGARGAKREVRLAPELRGQRADLAAQGAQRRLRLADLAH